MIDIDYESSHQTKNTEKSGGLDINACSDIFDATPEDIVIADGVG